MASLSRLFTRFWLIFLTLCVGFGNLILELLSLLYPLKQKLGHLLFGEAFPLTASLSGSGDGSHHWVQLLFNLILAVFITGLWQFRARHAEVPARWVRWHTVFLRYFLGILLWSYGSAKLFKTQFPTPSLVSLSQAVGDGSPMGLAWTYMGYSPLYNLFTGSLECLGAVLLFFPQTVLLGSLLSLGLMGHIFVMNLSFDIPVKINSAIYTLMLLWLIWPFRRELKDRFLVQRSEENPPLPPPKRRLTLLFRSLLLPLLLLWLSFLDVQRSEYFFPRKTAGAWGGVYSISKATVVQEAPSLAFPKTWTQIVIDYPTMLAVRTHDKRYWINYQPIKSTNLDMVFAYEGKHYLALFSRNREADLELTGKFCEIKSSDYHLDEANNTYIYPRTRLIKQCEAQGWGIMRFDTRRKQRQDYLLINRGFHWRNETPLMR